MTLVSQASGKSLLEQHMIIHALHTRTDRLNDREQGQWDLAFDLRSCQEPHDRNWADSRCQSIGLDLLGSADGDSMSLDSTDTVTSSPACP